MKGLCGTRPTIRSRLRRSSPRTNVTMMVSGKGQPSQTSQIAATPPNSPIIEPTERSISAEIMTNTIPTARMPVIAVWRNRLETLRALK